MDKHDEMLVDWFDSKFRPALGKELYFAGKMAGQKMMGQSNPYWEGYHAALGMVNDLVEDGIGGIEEACDDD